jgi:putative oxidoreductase
MNLTTVLFWLCAVAMAAPAVFHGYQKLTQNPEKTTDFARWGYPKWFMVALGATEILGGIGILFPISRPYCIATYAVILVGALATHLKAKDPMKEVMPPIFVGLLLLVIYFLQPV